VLLNPIEKTQNQNPKKPTEITTKTTLKTRCNLGGLGQKEKEREKGRK
jgi:hypothetical protein